MSALIADPFTRFIAQVAAVMALSRLIGLGMKRLGQPQVIAEIIAGIMLGPSLLGWVAPGTFSLLFGGDSLGILSAVSHTGLVLFMFLIGLELDHRMLRGRGRVSLIVSYTGIAVSVGLAVLVSLWFYPEFAGSTASFAAFALFMSASMGITAFPVLARILAEQKLLRSQLGALAIACAAIDDLTAWCLLAFAVAAVRSGALVGALTTTGLAVGYVALMLFAIRPMLVRLARTAVLPQAMSPNVIAAVLLLLLLSSWTTELIGIHSLFGAFLFGAIVPRDHGFARAVVEKLESLVEIVLVPLFFAFSGLRTEIGLLDSSHHWALAAVLIYLATVGKAGGSAIAARLSGLTWRESGALGVLMNTRGLMGVIVLNIGLDLGVISTTLFSMMVVMALVTTMVASPLLEWIYSAADRARDMVESSLEPEPEPRRPGERVLVCIGDADAAGTLVEIGHAVMRGRDGARIDAVQLLTADEPSPGAIDGASDKVLPSGLQHAVATGERLGIEVKPLSFVSSDVARDICRIASVREVKLLLMSCGDVGADGAGLGEVIDSVLAETTVTLAVLVGRGQPLTDRVVVARNGSDDERIAFQIARQVAGDAGTVQDIELGAGGTLPASVTASSSELPLLVFAIDPGRYRTDALGSQVRALLASTGAPILLVRGSPRPLAMTEES